MNSDKRLKLSSTDKKLFGVCGGIAEYFGIDATLVRIAFVITALLGGPGAIVYIVLWLVLPKDEAY